MPNKNYLSGRRFEWETMRDYEQRGYRCIRASGSHGEFDVIAYHVERKPNFIQCKVVATLADRKRLVKDFCEHTRPSVYFHQTLAVRLKGRDKREVSI